MAKYLINSARTLIFSTALPPPAVAAAMSALGLLAEQPRRVEKLKRNAAVLRAALNDNGLPVPAGETPIVPLIVGEASEAVRASDTGPRTRHLRPGDPASDRPGGQLAPTPRGDGLAHEVGAARSGSGSRRPSCPPRRARHRGSPPRRSARACSTACATPRSAGARGQYRRTPGSLCPAAARRRARAAPAWVLGRAPLAAGPQPPLMRGIFVTGTGTGVGKSVLAAAACAALAARGLRVAAFKPAVTGLDEPSPPGWPPDHELLARAAGAGQTAPRRWRPTASGARCRPITPPSWPAWLSTPGDSSTPPGGPPRAPMRWCARGWAA